MKMLLLVAGDFIEDVLADVLTESGIMKYTLVSKSQGVGEAGKDGTIVIFAAVTEQQADFAVTNLKKLRAQRVKAQQGKPFPLRMFSLPCEQVL